MLKKPSIGQIIRRVPWSFESMAWKAPPARRPPALAFRPGARTFSHGGVGRLPGAARPPARQFAGWPRVAPYSARPRRLWTLPVEGARLAGQVRHVPVTRYIQTGASIGSTLQTQRLSRRLVTGLSGVTLRARSTQTAPAVRSIPSRRTVPPNDTAVVSRIAQARIAAQMQAQRLSLLAG